ncbi:uncharacterized protein EV420DRAFT_1639278 [Desarmillaria tabescens]|uniref:XPG-I domain-containing protein n=1 Tax=Armillaria tabescens TaxID=1929756 RepID=A0AA39TTK9_ARMTA|nr:uncharacterized protein EV420DRAFT_1639278 [Desarmillaria tabescens]KAK0463169.1 hypothetical protein EV420DRAFT_1639278 [Desarmillaria tabescens]
MGIKSGWNLLRPVESLSMIDWSAQVILTGSLHALGPRIGIDARYIVLLTYILTLFISLASGWIFAAKYHYAQTKNAAHASLFKRLGRLFHLPVFPLFVFDGPERPIIKWNKKIKKGDNWLTHDFKRLLEGFGFAYWDAPGEAEAELTMLSKIGRIDASEYESDSQYMIQLYEKGTQFSPNDLVMIALLAGGDYDNGIEGGGIKTAVHITSSGIRTHLFENLEGILPDGYPTIIAAWQQDLCTMLSSEETHKIPPCARSLISHIPPDFPKVSVLVQYLCPVISDSMFQNLPAAPALSQPDIPKLARLCEELFIWGDSMGIIQNFSNHIFPGLAIRELLHDLCLRRRLIQPMDTCLTSHAIISKACSIHRNQHQRSESEIFVSLIIPPAVVSQITSAITGRYETSTTGEKFSKWQEKHEVRVWLSRVLALHAASGSTELKRPFTETIKTSRQSQKHARFSEDLFIEVSSDEDMEDTTIAVNNGTIMINNITTARGICKVLDQSQAEYLASEEIIDDIEAEQETCPDSFDIDIDGDVQMDAGQSASQKIEEVLANIRAVSKGVNEGTDETYRNVMRTFNEFCIQEKIITRGTDIFTQKNLDHNMDYYIIGFIMSKCITSFEYSVLKSHEDARRSFSLAEKLHSGITYGFQRAGGWGKTLWDKATAAGNPSISELVSSYMLSLRRRKIAKGDAPTST